MDILSKYPVDFELLEKGTTIEQPELEKIFSCTPDDKNWGLEMLKLSKLIEINAGILVRKSHNSLVLMADEEAAEYLFEIKFLGGYRRMGAAVRNVGMVNMAQLSATSRASFESRTRIMAGTVQASRTSMQKLKRIEKLLELQPEAGAEVKAS